MQNSNPIIYQTEFSTTSQINSLILDNSKNDKNDDEDDGFEEINSAEIFEMIRYLNDPEHPLTLEQLNVVSITNISVENKTKNIEILFTPTIPHCSMATLIGLCIRVKILRSLSNQYKVTIKVFPGTHQSEDSINKQLNDKERVAAALENIHLLDAVNKCIHNTDKY
jgi:metal-sulfur cluster biosynthetic enzyme